MAEYELWHYGVKGMKWGVRRFQKKDGTLTSAGKKKYQGSRGDIEKEYENYNENDHWGKIASEIESKSGEWYNQTPVSKGYKEVINWDNSERKKLKEWSPLYEFKRKKLERELDQRLASVALKDLGYNDTEAGRKFLIENNLLRYN